VTESGWKDRIPGLGTQMLIAFAVGIPLGWLFPDFGNRLELLSQIFIRMVLMLIAPLVFSVVVVGIADLKDAGGLASMGVKAFVYFFGVTALALVLGFAIGELLSVGAGVSPAAAGEGAGGGFSWDTTGEESFWVRIFPSSIVDAMARGDVLQIVVFALFFAIALAAVGNPGEPVLEFLRSLTEVMYRFTGYVMAVAPLGVLGATAAVVAQQGGAAAMAIFGKLALAVGLGLGALLLILFPAIALFFSIPFLRLVVAVKEAAILAFATASSAAALPEAMAELEEWGVPRFTVGFVFPTGLTFNLAGSTAYLGIAAVFVLQMAEIPLGTAAFLQLFVILFVASKGVPQVPRGSFVVLAAALATFGAPDEAIAAGIGILLGVDALLDMARTGTNVIGNCLATAVVARWEGDLEGRTLGAPTDAAGVPSPRASPNPDGGPDA